MKRGTIVLHPILFAVFPTLFLFAQNLGGFRLGEMAPPAVSAAVIAGAAWLGLAFLMKNGRKAGIIVAALAVMFSSYGYFAEILYKAGLSGEWTVRIIIFAAYAAIFAGVIAVVVKAKGTLVNVTRALNFSAAFLVAVSAARIGAYEVGEWRSREAFRSQLEAGSPVKLTRPTEAHNIFYIILDAYGRADNLKELYGFDNSETLQFLKSKGFYIAEQSRTNYSHTTLSIPSFMNFRYLATVSGKAASEDVVPLRDMLGNNKACELLRGVGYRIVSFNSRDEIYSPDVCMAPKGESDFTRGLDTSSAASTPEGERAKDRARIVATFEHLPDAADLAGPVFVYAHIMAPHPPFVFLADGEDPGYERYFGTGSADAIIRPGALTREEDKKQYCEQLAYVNKLLESAVEGILAKSKIPPIIVIQGDHGPGAYLCHESIKATYLADRMSILNAYYLPDGADKMLYSSITPVNTFRVIFNAYFGAKCPLLKDESYFAPLNRPWDPINVTAQINSPEDKARLAMLERMDYFPRMPTAKEDSQRHRKVDGAKQTRPRQALTQG